MASKDLSVMQPDILSYYADNAKKLHRIVDKIKLSQIVGL